MRCFERYQRGEFVSNVAILFVLQVVRPLAALAPLHQTIWRDAENLRGIARVENRIVVDDLDRRNRFR
jgi:hypothetical protein